MRVKVRKKCSKSRNSPRIVQLSTVSLLKRFLYHKNSRKSRYGSGEDFVLVLKNVIADFIAHIKKFKLLLK
jgi:hypothetical protein